MVSHWRLDLGASVRPDGVQFRVWAPRARRVEVELAGPGTHCLPMERDTEGVWQVELPEHGGGTRYKYRLDGQQSFPDPYSRSQPLGVHGPSEVVDPAAYPWSDHTWPGLARQGLVIYECHVGTVTPTGTCEALLAHLPRLADLGISAIELMPVAAFPGRRNWGYDGVYPFAVSANYGGPVGLKRLVDAAHRHGLGVLLDVVYNHLGPEGNYFRQFSPDYFSICYRTPWGEALNYDGPHCRWVRRLAIDNACYWLHEYHLDGLRLDAVGQIFDSSQPHLLQELTETVRAALPAGRQTILIAETSANDVRYLLPPNAGGYGFDAVWADDFYWTLRRYATGEHEGRYQDYQGTLAEVASTINQGFLYEGAYSAYRRRPRGAPARQQPAWQFQYCLQHHDHVGNRAFGERLHHHLDLAWYRVASAVLLLLPYTPLLFMGQEFVASTPFLFFTDHSPELGRRVAQGRRREFAQYTAFADPAAAARLPDPQADETFQRSKLSLEETAHSPGKDMHCLYRELLWLRRTDPILRQQDRHRMQAQAVTPELLAITWQYPPVFRLLLANFGGPAALRPADLVDAQETTDWRIMLETSEPRFGGHGEKSRVQAGTTIHLTARTAVFIAAGGDIEP